MSSVSGKRNCASGGLSVGNIHCQLCVSMTYPWRVNIVVYLRDNPILLSSEFMDTDIRALDVVLMPSKLLPDMHSVPEEEDSAALPVENRTLDPIFGQPLSYLTNGHEINLTIAVRATVILVPLETWPW